MARWPAGATIVWASPARRQPPLWQGVSRPHVSFWIWHTFDTDGCLWTNGTIDEATRTMLSLLPATCEIDTIASPVLLCHGTGADGMVGIHEAGMVAEVLRGRAFRQILGRSHWTIMVCGHTHRRFVIGFDDARTDLKEKPYEPIDEPHTQLAVARDTPTPRKRWCLGLFVGAHKVRDGSRRQRVSRVCSVVG